MDGVTSVFLDITMVTPDGNKAHRQIDGDFFAGITVTPDTDPNGEPDINLAVAGVTDPATATFAVAHLIAALSVGMGFSPREVFGERCWSIVDDMIATGMFDDVAEQVTKV